MDLDQQDGQGGSGSGRVRGRVWLGRVRSKRSEEGVE